MEQLTKNQAVATSQEAVQNQNEPQLRDENAHNEDRKSGSAGMPRPISYAVFCLKKKKEAVNLASGTRKSSRFPGLACGRSIRLGSAVLADIAVVAVVDL